MIYLKFHFFNECFWNLRTWNYVNQNFYIWIKKFFFSKLWPSFLYFFLLYWELVYCSDVNEGTKKLSFSNVLEKVCPCYICKLSSTSFSTRFNIFAKNGILCCCNLWKWNEKKWLINMKRKPSEAATGGNLWKKMFLKISQNL